MSFNSVNTVATQTLNELQRGICTFKVNSLSRVVLKKPGEFGNYHTSRPTKLSQGLLMIKKVSIPPNIILFNLFRSNSWILLKIFLMMGKSKIFSVVHTTTSVFLIILKDSKDLTKYQKLFTTHPKIILFWFNEMFHAGSCNMYID